MSVNIAINLIPKARQVKAERRRRLSWWGGAWAVYAAVLGLLVGSMYLRFSTTRDLAGELAKENEQLTTLKSEQQMGTAEFQRVSQTIASSRGLLEQPDWSQLLSILSDLRGHDIALAGVDLELTPEQSAKAPVQEKKATSKKKIIPTARKTKWNLQMTGFGKTPESVSQFVLRLESTALFDQVNLLKTNREPFGTADATSFSISCPLKGHGRSTQ